MKTKTRKSVNRILAIVMALMMVVAMLPTAAFAAEANTFDQIQDLINSGEGNITLGGDIEATSDHPVTLIRAEGGSKTYATLAEAVEAAQDGDIVQLIANIEKEVLPTADSTSNVDNCVAYISAGQTVTIDLNGYTISAKGADEAKYDVLAIRNHGNLTITDSSEDKAGKVTLSFSGTQESGTSQIHSTILNFGTLTIKAGTIENAATTGYGRYAIDNYSWGGNAKLAVEDATIIGHTSGAGCAIYANSYSDNSNNACTVSISGGEVKGGVWYSNGGTNGETSVVITAGTLTEGNNPALAIKGTAPSVAVISGGNFVGEVSIVEGVKPITGGTFTDEDVKDYVADGYEMDEDGKVVEAASAVVAKVNGVGYETLQAAVNAAVSEGVTSIRLESDVELEKTVHIPAGVTLTIFGNGKTITPAANFATDGNGAVIVLAANDTAHKEESVYTVRDLTIKGFSGLTRVIRANFSNATIAMCTFENNSVSEGVITSAYSNLYVLDNTFSGNTAGFAVVNAGSDVNNGTTLLTRINGNTFTANKAGVAGVYMAVSGTVRNNYFSGNTHTGTNPNGAAILAGPYTGNMSYSIEINGNAFENAMSNAEGALPAVFAEDWSSLGSTTRFDLSSNYWGGARPVEGTAYMTSGDAPQVTLTDYYASYENGELGGLTSAAPTVEPPVVIPENIVDTIVGSGATEEEKKAVQELVDEIAVNTALSDETYQPVAEVEGVEELVVTLSDIDLTESVPTVFTYTVEPKDASGNKVSNPSSAITFRLPIPASVTKAYAKVSHNGTVIGTYEIKGEGSAKYVEVTSDSFSTYTAEPTDEAPAANVAEVDTWDELVAAVADTNVTTIKMTADITAAGRLVVDRNLTIDMNGCDLNLTQPNNRIWKAATLTITGKGKIDCSAVVGGNVFYIGSSETGAGTAGNLILNDITMYGDNYNTGTNAAVFMMYNTNGNTTLNIIDCEINLSNNQGNGSVFYDTGSTATCKVNIVDSVLNFDSTVRGSVYCDINIDNSDVVIKNSNNGFNQAKLTIKNGSDVQIFDNDGRGITLNSHGYDVIIEDSTVTLYNNGEGDILYKNGGNLSITNSTMNECNVVVESGAATINGSAVVNGSTVKSVDGVVTVTPPPVYVAEVNGVKYTDLKEAFAAAQNGDTITLLADSVLDKNYGTGLPTAASVINLNGHTLTLTQTDNRFGTTTFKNGTIDFADGLSASTGIFYMFGDHTLTFDNVKIDATGLTGTYLVSVNNTADVVLTNGMQLVIDNDASTSLIAAISCNGDGNTVTINNSKVTVNNMFGRVFLGGSYTVQNGSVITASGVKAGFLIRDGQTLAIQDTSAVTVTDLVDGKTLGIDLAENATYTKADTATVNATVTELAPAEITTIASVDDLKKFAELVNGGNDYADKIVTLTADLDLTGIEWTPIGTGARSSKSYKGNAFKGTFDGGDHTISGLTITSTADKDNALGLFGVVDGGTVKNLKLADVNLNVAGSDLLGAAIGMMLNGATAEKITVSGAIVGHDGVGGIVGRLIVSGTISDCTNNASVTSSYGGIGGIVGKPYYEDSANTALFANIIDCTNNGTITAPMYVGGIAGLARANVTDCVNNGAVVGGTQTGGIIGQLIAAGAVSGNENKAKITGKNHMGGIIGDYTQSSAYTYYNVTIANNINRGELAATEQCAAIMGCNNIDGFTAMTAIDNVSYYYVDGMELFGNPEDMVIDDTNKFIVNVVVTDAENNVKYYPGFEGFSSLELANCTIKLLNNVSDKNLILNKGSAVDTNVVLDLNGFTFSRAGSTSPAISLLQGAELTVRDSSEAKTGKILADTNAIWIQNGTLVIESGTIETTSTAKAAIEASAAELTVQGGKIVAANDAILVGENFLESRGVSTVTVTGGEIEAAGRGIAGGAYAQDETAVAVSGGKITSTGESINMTTGGVASVTGGTFSTDVSAYAAEGFVCKQNTDGTYGVAQAEAYVAQIGTQGFATLQAAVEAAVLMTGDVTIEILAGTHAEDINLTNVAVTVGDVNVRPNITFKPAEDAAVTLAGTVTLGYRQQNVGASMWNGEVTFEGITFDHAQSAMNSLNIQDVKGISLIGCKVIGDGEYGITSAGSNGTPKGSFTNCTFENGAMQVLGQLGANLVVDNCVCTNFAFNVQGGATPGMTIKNTTFNMTLTDAHVGESFYAIRTNACPVNISNTKFNVDSTVTGVAADQLKWGIFWARKDSNVKWNVADCEVNLTDAALAQTELLLTKNDADAPNGPDRMVFTNLTSTSNDVAELVARSEGYLTANGSKYLDGKLDISGMVAKIGDTYYATLAEAAAAAQSGDEIILIADAYIAEKTNLMIPDGVILNGNGFCVYASGADHNNTDNTWGNIEAGGALTIKGITKIEKISAGSGDVVTIGKDARLEIIGAGRVIIGHGATFNITGNIADAKTAVVAEQTPSLIMPGASFTGAGVTFNVTNAYLKFEGNYCSSSKYASGTFDFNITNSIWNQVGTKLAFEAQSTAATVNFDLKDSVLTTGSHLIFGVTKGEIVIDNSSVNVGVYRQLENRSNMTIKNGSVVYASVQTSSNANNPGITTVDNATYVTTGEFSGAALGIGTLNLRNGADFTTGTISKMNVTVDATSKLTANKVAADSVTIKVDAAGITGTEIKVIDLSQTAALTGVELINGDGYELVFGDDGDVTIVEKAIEADMTTIYVNAAWADKAQGTEVETGKYIGYNAFASLLDITEETVAANTEKLVIYGGSYANTENTMSVNLLQGGIKTVEAVEGTVVIETGNLVFKTSTPGMYTITGTFQTADTETSWPTWSTDGVTRFGGADGVTFKLVDAHFTSGGPVQFIGGEAVIDADSTITLDETKWTQMAVYADVTCYGEITLVLNNHNGSLLNIGHNSYASNVSKLTLSGEKAKLTTSMPGSTETQYDVKVNDNATLTIENGAEFTSGGYVVVETENGNSGKIVSSSPMTVGTLVNNGTVEIDATAFAEGDEVIKQTNADAASLEGKVTVTVAEGYEVSYGDDGDVIIRKKSNAIIRYGAIAFISGTVGQPGYRERLQVNMSEVFWRDSLYVEMWSGETKLSTTTVRTTDRDDGTPINVPADGLFTANIVLKGELSGSWDTVWHEELTVANLPDTIKVYVDGELTHTMDCGFQKEEYKELYLSMTSVYKAAFFTDANGKTQYFTSLNTAIKEAPDGATVYVLPGTIDEYIAPWANDSQHTTEKSITLLGASEWTEGETILTGGMYLGYDDSQCRDHSITVKGFTFQTKGILVACQKNVTIEGNKFTNITETVTGDTGSAGIYAIAVIGKDINATVTDNYIENVIGNGGCGIHLRDVVSVSVTGNTVINVADTAIMVNETSSGAASSAVIKDNILTTWGTSGAGRAIRSTADTFTANGNVMTCENAPEAFIKATVVTTIDVSGNYWNGIDPTTERTDVEEKYFETDDGVNAVEAVQNYYKTYENGVLGDLTELEGDLTDENLRFYTQSLRLESFIGADFVVYPGCETGYDSIYIVFEREGSDPVKVETYDETPLGGGMTLKSFGLKLAAKEMGDKVTGTLYGVKGGVTYKGQTVKNWSVEQKLYEMLETRISKPEMTEKERAQCAMILAMLDYGAEAQIAFNHAASNLVNADAEKYAEYATATTPNMVDNRTVTDNGLTEATLLQAALGLESVVEHQTMFAFPDTNFESYEARITYGNGRTDVIAGKDFVVAGGTWAAIVIDDIAVKEMGTQISITIYRNGVAISETHTLGILDIAAGMVGGKRDSLVKALATYSKAAELYFNND